MGSGYCVRTLASPARVVQKAYQIHLPIVHLSFLPLLYDVCKFFHIR